MPEILKDQTSFENAVKAPTLSVIHFQADWADQCAQVNDLLDAISKQSNVSSIKFYACPAEDLNEVSYQYKIEAVPTVLLFKQGKEIDRIDGADAQKITEQIKRHSEGTEVNEVPLEERLKSLINSSKVMLFMKGDRNTPRCGFSKQIIAILNDTGVAYDTFDILTDEEVRQGLKQYSDWPTYPQLYIKGDLIGGLDIVKEMLTSGELDTMLKS